MEPNSPDTKMRSAVLELVDSAPVPVSLPELDQNGAPSRRIRRAPKVRFGFDRARSPWVGFAAAVIILIAIALAATGSLSSDGRHALTHPGSEPHMTAFDRQKVVSAVLTANQDEILSQMTQFVNPSGQVVSGKQVLVDSTGGNAVSETLSSSGSPADALVFDAGSVINIDYAKQVWWTVNSAGAGPPTLQDPEATTSGIQSLVSSGQLKVASSSSDLNGQPATELVGQGVLPGSSLTLWVSQATDLPIQAIGNQSDGSEQITSYQWLDRNVQNLALVTPAVPSGFTQLSGPPLGEVPASPLG
jgi:hypothetical protein